MKKKVYLFVGLFICSLLVGCSCEKKNNANKKPNDIVQDENIINDLYTDEEKLVYDNNGLFKIVFYYSDDNITGLEHYYEYENEIDAEKKYKEDIEKYKNNAQIEKINRNGRFVVYTIVDTEYAGKTVSDIKETYSFLIPVYKK